jgi:chromosome partitioning protein
MLYIYLIFKEYKKTRNRKMVLSIIHQKGGVGKSTISWNLALMLSKFYKGIKKIVVVDLDSQKTITTLNNIRRTSTKRIPLEIVELSTKEELISYIKNDSEEVLTIIDTGGFDSEINRLAAILSDIVINPVSDEPLELMGLKRYQEILKDMNENIKEKIKPFIVFNKIKHNTKNLEHIKNYVRTEENYRIMDTIIRRKIEISDTPLQGISVVEFDPKSKAALNFKELETEVIQIIENMKK